MSNIINCVNAGLISQNYDVINNVTRKYAGSKTEELQEKSSGKMKKCQRMR